jgi:hypothetical protein
MKKRYLRAKYVPNGAPIEVDAWIVSHWSSHENPVIVHVHTKFKNKDSFLYVNIYLCKDLYPNEIYHW